MSKNTPAPPDYAGAAANQAQSSREVTEQQTWANRPTINTPFGQQSWAVTPQWDPSTGQYLNSWTQNTNLTPESQQALDSQMQLQQSRSDLANDLTGRMESEFSSPMNWGGFQDLSGPVSAGQLQTKIGNTPDYIKSAGDAIYGQWSDRQEPRMQQESEALRTRLYNQGLTEGDQAYDQAMQRMTQDQGDARQQAQYQATIGSGAEAQRMQGMDVQSGNFGNNAQGQQFQQNMGAAGFQNTLRQQQMAEAMQQRGFTLNEINAIMNGQQVGMPNMPSFNAANRSEGNQALQAAGMGWDAQMDAFNAQQQQQQGMMSGAGSMAMMFSDRRLKDKIILVGRRHGLNVYEYEYIWEPGHRREGYMADEVEELFPDAVRVGPSGYKMVNYARLP